MKKYFGFVAISVFLLSCTNTDRDNPNDMWGSNYIGKSSAEGSSSSVEADEPSSSSGIEEPSSSSSDEELISSSAGVSSSVETDNYPSSSSVVYSSSSAEPSSSSAEPSSSSVAPSSSSVVPSSSSAEPSSSSGAESSSSIATSSSSATLSSSSSEGLCTNFVEGTPRLHYGKHKEQFCDERDGKKYVYVVIGDQTWMAENLNYDFDTSNSTCYGNQTSRCTTYGRLYNWETAKTVCPFGWHLPTMEEWNLLGYDEKILKTTIGWSNKGTGNGTDDYGFSVLPGGFRYSGGFKNVGDSGYWWTASMSSELYAYSSIMGYNEFGGEYIGAWYGSPEDYFFSVRCLKDQSEPSGT